MNDKIKIYFIIYFRTQRRHIQNFKVSKVETILIFSDLEELVSIIYFPIRSNAMRDNEDELNILTYIDDDWIKKKKLCKICVFSLDIILQRVLPVRHLVQKFVPVLYWPLLLFFLSHRLQWDWNKVKFNTKLWLKF